MRVHRLELRAFGPFAGAESLDFDALNDTGIFLLTGPTGAGKTSILDAICFALYGAVPGARNRAKAFKSQHAADEEVPRVELEATIRGRRFRIARSPAWRRPSRRAKGGFVDEHAKVLVEEHVGEDWIARATRLDEAGLLIGRVLGMTQEQFCQVVMLPQGQFETFLRADAKERHDLLETLFETSRFRRVEQWLAEARRARETAWERAQARIDQVFARAVEVVGQTPVARELGPEPDAVSGQDETNPAVPNGDGGDSSVLPTERVLEQLRSWEAEIVELAAAAEVFSAEHLVAAKAARHAFDEATRLAERQERHREARRRLVALRTAQPTADERAHRVRSALAAATLAPLLTLVDEAEQSFASARDACDEAQLALRAHDDLGLSLGDEPRAELAGTREHRGRVAGLAAVEAEVRRLTAELTDRRTELADCESALETLEGRATAIPPALAEAQELVAVASTAAANVEATTALLAQSVERLDAARAVEQLSAELATIAAEHLALREERVRASERLQELRERRLSGMAAELALGLEPGCPCPVCGSASHPRLAEPFDDRVTEIDETQAAAVLRRADAELETCAERLASLRADLAGAERGAAQIGVAVATDAVATARARLDEALHARAALAGHQADVAALSAEQGRVETKIAELRTTITTLSAACGDTAAALTRHSDDLGAVLGQHGSVDKRLAAVDRRVAMLERLVAAEHDRQEAVARRDRHRLQLEDALADSEFAAASEVRQALLSKAEVANLEALNRTHDEELAAVSRVLTDPGLVEAAEQEAPDLVALSIAADTADQQRVEAHAEARALMERRDRLEGLLSDVDRLLDQAAPLRTAVDVATRVASMVAGTARDNEHKTRLSHYVVAARLEQVVAAANVRLRDVGGGRYQLEHSLSRGAGSSRGGLSLVVLDAYTGLRRDPVTLSGGETFYVSLALALGLADLVRSEAGAADLSTLFVDEGFGGLDAETLDEVMDTIDELRAGGRCVGLVSHLSELRMRIPTQVQVVRSRSGSRIEALS